ncbi:MAG TPA: cyclic nucleotide-binding domain-containing protein [Candidatus Limnocylindrales bacterium]|nr:cyclic nucleotide-binding domain-containing protein [Candidatus Limnocylindrales bacterium]
MRRVQLAFLLFSAAEYGTWVAILLYAYDATGRGSVGLAAVVQLIPAAILAPFAAAFADRFRRDRVLLGGYLVQALAFCATGAAMLLRIEPIIVYILAAAAACSLTITRPAQGSLLPGLARTPEELTAANGLSGTVEGVGLLLGPLAGAGILAISSPASVLVAGAAACLAAALLVFQLHGPVGVSASDIGATAADEHEHVGLLAGLRVLAAEADARLVVGILSLRMVVSGAMDVLFVLFALEVLRSGLSGAGILTGALGLGTVAGGAMTFALVGRRRLAPALALSAATLGAALLAVGLGAPAPGVPVLIAVGGIGYAACDVAGRTILQRATPNAVLGRTLGALEGLGLAGVALGSLLVPPLVGLAGTRGTLLLVSLLLPIGIGAGWAGLRRIDRRSHVPVRELSLLRAVPIFAALPAPALESVARHARWLTVEEGDVIIREGDIGDRYYVLESGRVVITHDNVELRVTDQRGDGFGEIALLRDVRRTASVTAAGPGVLLALERADFLEAVTGHPQTRRVAEEVAQARSPSEPDRE